MSLDPGPRHRQGHGPDPAPLLRAQGHGHVPGGAGATRRTSSAAGCSCSTTSGARSSARPASSAPRPARSSASTWAASTRAAATTSTGARPRRTASGARNRRCGAPAGPVPGPGLPAVRGRSTSPRVDAILEEYDHDPAQMLADPRGDPGGVRLPAGRRAQADQPADRRLVRDDLRHRDATTATCGSSRPTATRPGRGGRRATGRPRRPTSPRSTRRSPAAGERRDAAPPASRRGPDRWPTSSRRPQAWPSILLARAARHGPDRPRRGRRAPARSTACARVDPRPRARPATIADDRGVRPARPRRRRLPGRATSGGPPRRPTPPRRYVVANGYGADPATGTDRTCSSATRTRVIEGAAIAAFADRRRARSSSPSGPTPPRPSARLEAAIGAAEDAGFLGVDVLGSGHDIDGRRSGRSRAPTCSARRRSCSRRSRASAASPSSARRTRPSAACSACRPSSTTSRPWPPCPGSSATAPRRSPRSARRRARARSSSRSAAPAGDGIAEVPLGTPLRDDRRPRRRAAGGRSLKAVLVGGPSGGLLPPDLLDTPYDFDAAARGRRPRRLGLGRRRRRPGLHRRPGPAADPLLRRRGVRQDDPVPDRDPPPGRDRRARRRAAGRGRPTSTLLDRPVGRHRRRPRCATTSAWRPSR